jgi:hypothetical protein
VNVVVEPVHVVVLRVVVEVVLVVDVVEYVQVVVDVVVEVDVVVNVNVVVIVVGVYVDVVVGPGGMCNHAQKAIEVKTRPAMITPQQPPATIKPQRQRRGGSGFGNI